MKKDLPLINERIRADKIQVITHEGVNIGVVSRYEALKKAEEAGLDLVLISEKGGEGVPVAKVMDFGKAMYAKKKKDTEAKKKQKVIKVKEIKIRPKISEHDFQTKINQAIQFLEDGMRVKITLVFKGREASGQTEVGPKVFEKINSSIEESGLKNIVSEQDSKSSQFWSKVYYLKGK